MWYLVPLGLGYVVVNILAWVRMKQLIGAIWHEHKLGRIIATVVYSVVHLFLMTTIVSWTLFDNETIVHALKFICNVWLGVFLYIVLWSVVAEVVTFIRWIVMKRRGTHDPEARHLKFRLCKTFAVAIVVCIVSVYGVVHADNIHVVNYDVDVDKDFNGGQPVKIALISDTHLGYSVGNEQMERMVAAINKSDVDLVLIAGDIIDNEFYAIADPDKIADTLSGLNAKYGVYGIYGNHDVQERLVGGFSVYDVGDPEVQSEVDDMIRSAGITLLQDEIVEPIDGVQIIGRIDGETPNTVALDGSESRKTIGELVSGLDKNKLIIDLDHEPSQLDEKSEAGVDLDLCGHTHDGQIFPGNITIKFFWENAYGYKKYGNMNSIVTSGVGVWGPAMRVGTNAEVVIINVK